MPEPYKRTWQQITYPLIAVGLFLLLLCFIWIYIYEANHIRKSLIDKSNYSTDSILQGLDSLSYSDKLYKLEMISLLNRHYHANLIIRSRILTVNLSFLTGMVLTFMGGFFVFGKFSEKPTTFSTQGVATVSISSSSPGIIIACLGIALIMSSIFSKSSVMIEDRPVYLLNSVEPVKSTNIILKDHPKSISEDLKELDNVTSSD
jgi:hypothetical protein